MKKNRKVKLIVIVLVISLCCNYVFPQVEDLVAEAMPQVIVAEKALMVLAGLLGLTAATQVAATQQTSIPVAWDTSVNYASPPGLRPPSHEEMQELAKLLLDMMLGELESQLDAEIERRIQNGEIPPEFRFITKALLIHQFHKTDLKTLTDFLAKENIYNLPINQLYDFWSTMFNLQKNLEDYFENVYIVQELGNKKLQAIRNYTDSYIFADNWEEIKYIAVNNVRVNRDDFSRLLKILEEDILEKRGRDTLVLHITSVDTSFPPGVSTYVTVMDGLNRCINDMEDKASFRVIDNGVPCTNFSVKRLDDKHIKTETGIAVVVDSSSSMSGEPFELARQGAADFIANMRAKDKPVLITFSDTVSTIDITGIQKMVEAPETAENVDNKRKEGQETAGTLSRERVRQYIMEELANNWLGGDTAMYNALYQAISELNRPNTRRIVVLLSDGDDNASRYNIHDIKKLAVETGTTIFGIALGNPAQHANLQELARYTGGECFFSPEAANLSEIYAKITDIVSTQYKISYSLENFHLQPGETRTLEISALRGGIEVNKKVEYRVTGRQAQEPSPAE